MEDLNPKNCIHCGKPYKETRQSIAQETAQQIKEELENRINCPSSCNLMICTQCCEWAEFWQKWGCK